MFVQCNLRKICFALLSFLCAFFGVIFLSAYGYTAIAVIAVCGSQKPWLKMLICLGKNKNV